MIKVLIFEYQNLVHVNKSVNSRLMNSLQSPSCYDPVVQVTIPCQNKSS